MSTDYFVEGNPIKVSKLIDLSGIVKEFIVETELSNGEFKPTVLSHLSQNDHYTLRISIKSHCDDKVNYFWAYVAHTMLPAQSVNDHLIRTHHRS